MYVVEWNESRIEKVAWGQSWRSSRCYCIVGIAANFPVCGFRCMCVIFVCVSSIRGGCVYLFCRTNIVFSEAADDDLPRRTVWLAPTQKLTRFPAACRSGKFWLLCDSLRWWTSVGLLLPRLDGRFILHWMTYYCADLLFLASRPLQTGGHCLNEKGKPWVRGMFW